MRPYFDVNHVAGLLVAFAVLVWLTMELAQFSQAVGRRKGAVRAGRGGFWLAGLVVLAATNAALYLAPRLVPAAAIRPGAAAFAAGFVIMMGGIALRGWSFRTLGRYFTFTVMVSADQPVVSSGPYRWLRHPSYTGILLVSAGIGLASANWAGLAALVLLPLALILLRIRTEENALLAMLGEKYRSYALRHKRLVPLVW
jgi:protein-S-isoprenylcysteine O-methyltransferase Ste14